MDVSQYIHNLIYSYAECVDEGDFEALGTLFARGSIAYAPSGLCLTGAAEITGFFKKTVRLDPATGTPGTIHRVSNVILMAGDREWHARSRYEVTLISSEGRSEVIALGRYFDTFAVNAGDIHFQHRKVISEFLADDDRHVMLPRVSDNIINIERATAHSHSIPT